MKPVLLKQRETKITKKSQVGDALRNFTAHDVYLNDGH